MTEADLELSRLAERWRQLPLDQAVSRLPAVRAVVQSLADAVARREGRSLVPVPDLGPAVVVDQLTVVAYDAARAGLDPAHELAALRRDLA